MKKVCVYKWLNRFLENLLVNITPLSDIERRPEDKIN